MQLDRRSIVATGLGLTGLAAAAGAEPSTRQSPAKARQTTVTPNSGRDDTTMLQTAIDQAAARKEVLVMPAGTFQARTLHLPAGTHLSGSGSSTVLKHLGGPGLLVTENGTDITVESITLKGGASLYSYARALVRMRRVSRLTLRDLTITDSPADGISLERCSGIVTGCRITRAARAGIFSIDAEGGMEISHNHIADISNNGILVWRSALGEDGTIVAMNRIERIAARSGGTGEHGNAINVFRASNVLVTSNRISDCAFSAVRANSGSNVQILANNIARMGEVAIFVEFAFEGAVVSGNLVDGAATGISVTNFDHGGRLAVVQGNLIRNLEIHKGPSDPGGIGIAVEADAAVTGNTIEGAPVAGLSLGWGRFCRDIAATGNVTRKCKLGISITSLPDAGSVLVANNLISSSADGAIRLTDHGRPHGEDLALAPPTQGRVRAIGNVTV